MIDRTRFAVTIIAALVSATPLTAAASPGLTGTVVVVNQASDTVTLIDLETMEAYRHVDVVGGPHEVAVSPDGERAVVSNYNSRTAGPQKTLSLIALPGG